ncbi:LuxR C-terminal-related transcriptional regulator [Gandjariella thermophila]|uniref:DNA-binding response regulator n=1 Tax=Gandjariella thermophila TaxID=1931992 RepID=A0A4D4JFF3_9PSEU|nr:response regulator transcription factor [Gandjariella thermophila]GDY33388.1 DNA-binding response regulator [Gandjariella thermophila]
MGEGVPHGSYSDDTVGTEVAGIGVLLVDNEDLVRRGFRHALGEAPDITVVAEARVGGDALRLVGEHRPRVVLVDPGRATPQDGVEFVRALARAGADTGVIVLTSQARDDHLFRSLRAGARGFLLKSLSQEELVYAVRSVAEGKAFICPAMTRRMLDRFEILPPPDERSATASLAALSRRETQVLAGIAVGKSNQQIARELHLTAATVKSHVSHILAKLRLPNRMHAALLAYRLGLARPPWSPVDGPRR